MTKQEKISFIAEWYQFRDTVCSKHSGNCKGCPLRESTDGWPGENGKYEYVDNCKFSFDASYAEEIVDLMEEYQLEI